MAPLDRLRYRLRMIRLGFTLKPMAGADDPDPDPDPKPDPKPKKDDPDPDPDPDKIDPEDDWKAKARKHEAAVKRERKKREDAEQRLKDREEADKDDQQKAIDRAKADARKEALSEVEKDRRQERLETATERLAIRGFKVKVDDEEVTLRFADPDDALVYIERAIRKGDVDPDDIFDDEGKVQADTLKSALGDLLEDKPHLRADAEGSNGKPKADPDRGKGTPAGKAAEDLSVAEFDEQIRAGK